MNRHTKLALFLTPFLLIGGYIASDLYIEHEANQPKIFQLKGIDSCNIFSGNCILNSGNMQISISDNGGTTKANTSFPVDSVAVSLVYDTGKEIIYGLNKAGNDQYWERKTDIYSAVIEKNSADKLRVVAKIKGSMYFAELPSKTPSKQ